MKKLTKIILVKSPSGNYLALAGGYLAIINTNTNAVLKVKEPLITKETKLKFVYIGFKNIKWLNNDTLEYQKIEYTDKFFNEPPTYIVTKILDMRSKTTKMVN